MFRIEALALSLLLFSSSFGLKGQTRKLSSTCPNGESCVSDEDCKFCTKAPYQSCDFNSECSGGGNKCRYNSGSCSTSSGPTSTTAAPTSAPTASPPTATSSGVCQDGRICTSDSDCKVCTKDSSQACTADNQCSGGGNKCRAPLHSCAPSSTAAPTQAPASLTSAPTTTGVYQVLNEQDLPPYNYDVSAGNPLKGFLTNPLWTPHANQINTIPTSMDYYYIEWDTTMIGPNTFDWTHLDSRLNQSAEVNRHAIIRFILDYPNKGSYVPQYLIDNGLQMTPYTDFGGGESPDYSSSLLLEAFEEFILALGARYDGDQRLGFVQVGLLGFWGEWHTYPHSDWIPAATKDAVVSYFSQAFSQTPLQVRNPWTSAMQAGFGLHDDSFVYSTLSDNPDLAWFFWPSVVNSGFTDFWQQGTMGGELRPELQSTAFSEGFPDPNNDYEQDFDLCVSTTRATYMLNYYAFATPGYEGNELTRAQNSANGMGYHFQVTTATVSSSSTLEEANDIEIEITQKGVAPFYYPLSLKLSCNDGVEFQLEGVDGIVAEGSKASFVFQGVPSTPACLELIQLSLVSSHAYANNPVRFSQGNTNGVVEITFEIPP
mmetsp:Transcript_30788/g.46702  ORF Transcript_30788/g.46702 Transcript_30788/m.46702 type:complete len:600 (+) Transcript_30788:51-1850(+)